MKVKDLEVGAMYWVTPDLPPTSTFCCYTESDSGCDQLIYIGTGRSYGRKMVYLGTRVVGYKKGVWERRHGKNTQRLGLFGGKVMPIDPYIWKYIEPIEET